MVCACVGGDFDAAMSMAAFRVGCFRCLPPCVQERALAMALAALSGDDQRVIFVQLCNPLDPGVAVAFGSANSELW